MGFKPDSHDDRIIALERWRDNYGRQLDALAVLSLDLADALAEAATEEGMAEVISDMSTRSKIYFAVYRAVVHRKEEPTGASISNELGIEVADAAVQAFVEKIKAHGPIRRGGRRKKEEAQPIAVVDAASLPPTPSIESAAPPAVDAKTDLDAIGQMIILDDGEQSHRSLEDFVRFSCMVQQIGGIRKAAKYLRTMAELQHAFAGN